jgi:hypothetical protein
MPIDSRIVESRIPILSRMSAGTPECVMLAGKRLGPALAHRQLEYLQRVQEFECGGLAADNVERERGARAGALPLEQMVGRGVLVEVTKVMDFGHFGVVAQVVRDEPRVRVGFSLRMLSVSSDRLSIQQEWGSSWVPMALRSALMSFMKAFEPSEAPAMRSEWPPMYLVREYNERSAPCSIGR